MDLNPRLDARLVTVERENIDKIKTVREEIRSLQESIRTRQEYIAQLQGEVDNIRSLRGVNHPVGGRP